MTDNYGPAYQHMRYALRRLVTDDAGIKERLLEAWHHFEVVAMIGLNPNDPASAPDWMLEQARRLRVLWEGFDAPQILNAVESMSEEECRVEAEQLWEWYDRLVEEMD